MGKKNGATENPEESVIMTICSRKNGKLAICESGKRDCLEVKIITSFVLKHTSGLAIPKT